MRIDAPRGTTDVLPDEYGPIISELMDQGADVMARTLR